MTLLIQTQTASVQVIYCTLYNGRDYLSMPGLQLILVSKMDFSQRYDMFLSLAIATEIDTYFG